MNFNCRMATIISIVNQKGGVAKTTTALSLASGIARKNKDLKCLLVDLDPQRNATGVMVRSRDTADNSQRTIFKAFKTGKLNSAQINSTHLENLFFIPASISLVEVESMLSNELDGFYRLKGSLEGLKKEFFLIILDCPPSLSMITVNAMVTSDYLLIPLQASKFSLDGIQNMLDFVNTIQKRYNPNLKILGALMIMYDARATISQVIAEDIQKLMPVFGIQIPKSVVVEEAHLMKQDIYEYAPKSKITQEYNKLCEEIISELKKRR